MLHAGFNRMGMRIVETRKNGFPSEICFTRSGSCEAQHVFIGADGKKSAIADCHGLCLRLGLIYGPNFSVIQNDFRLF